MSNKKHKHTTIGDSLPKVSLIVGGPVGSVELDFVSAPEPVPLVFADDAFTSLTAIDPIATHSNQRSLIIVMTTCVS